MEQMTLRDRLNEDGGRQIGGPYCALMIPMEDESKKTGRPGIQNALEFIAKSLISETKRERNSDFVEFDKESSMSTRTDRYSLQEMMATLREMSYTDTEYMYMAEESINTIKHNFTLENLSASERVLDGSFIFLRAVHAQLNTSHQTHQLLRNIAAVIRSSGVSRMICDTVTYNLNTCGGWRANHGRLRTDKTPVFLRCFTILVNFSELCADMAIEMCSVDGFMRSIINELEMYCAYLAQLENHLNLHEEEICLISCLLGLCYNCCVVDENRQRLYELNLPAILLRYTTASRNEDHRLRALLALAEILDEEGSKKLQAGGELVRFLSDVLKSAFKNENHRDKRGWSVLELTRGLQHLALCDGNKRMVVESGVLPVLRDLVLSNVVLEQREALGAIWTLSFNAYNRNVILSDSILMDNLDTLRKSKDTEVRRIVASIMWTIRDCRDKDKVSNGSSTIHVPGPDQSGEKHIMISYQTANRETLLRVRDGLKAEGYKVWMDVDDISGSTIQSMAEAVQNSCLVLICVTQKYKDSHNCRSEAEYAYTHQRPIIPLMLQPAYKPDGWLGFIMGATKYHRFSDLTHFDKKFQDLLKDMKRTLNGGKDRIDVEGGMEVKHQMTGIVSNGLPLIPEQTNGYPTTKSVHRKDRTAEIRQWTKEDVSEWKKAHNLEFCSNPTASAKPITGKELVFMLNVKKEAPEYFYHILEVMFKGVDLHKMARFVEELQALLCTSS